MSISSPSPISEQIGASAAVTIQKTFRGMQTREAFLPRSLYSEYHTLCNGAKEPLPSAFAEKITTYSSPFVLKNLGRAEAKKCFHHMQTIRAILKSEKCFHLIIPKANLCGEFLALEKLPSCLTNEDNATTYRHNNELYTDAVRDLTRLFSKTYISSPTRTIEHCGKHQVIDIRYDNLPLLIKSHTGKIGLVNLEYADVPDLRSTNLKLSSLATAFPYHVSSIVDEAQRIKMTFNNSDIIRAATLGRSYLNNTRKKSGSKIYLNSQINIACLLSELRHSISNNDNISLNLLIKLISVECLALLMTESAQNKKYISDNR